MRYNSIGRMSDSESDLRKRLKKYNINPKTLSPYSING